ncbi:nitroreductase family protein [Porphyromonas sp.]|uniref:nitroreductase family protein n=1 Tax=Porphyromonas sp. TaxID=1924944 RepID=UPI0026DBDBBC|nr:nitroreductase family protein [Porphyromonas sp.]MDO4771329.1 nitroreductase family protein [Porphyromonas sp.]
MNELRLIDAIRTRRSIRIYHKDKPLSEEQLALIIEAGLRAPSSMNRHTTQFLIIDDRETLEALGALREKGSAFLADVPVAIVLLASPDACHLWMADASLAAGYMQLQAWEMGLGSCWAEVEGRQRPDGEPSDAYVRRVLNLPEDLEVVCILGFGYVNGDAPERPVDALKWEKVHRGSLGKMYK